MNDTQAVPLDQRVQARLKWLLAAAATPALTLFNALLMFATLVLALSADRALFLGWLALLWGGLAAYLAHYATVTRSGIAWWHVVLAYAIATPAFFLMVCGVFRLTGV